MDPPASPPKHMTRARAAAKASATTSASRAKSSSATARVKKTRSTATATTASSAAKRKTRPEDPETDIEEDELLLGREQTTMSKPTRGRGRPKKTVTEESAAAPASAPAPAPAAKPHRGRPKKTATAESASTSTTTRATRTRKTAHHADETTDDEGAISDAPTKKTSTRTRTKTTTSGAPTIAVRTAAANLTAHPTTKTAGPKKKVTFEEPEKENIAPKTTATKGKTAAASKTTASGAGLRAKPVRRGASATTAKATTTTTARSTRAASTSRSTTTAHVRKNAHVDKKHPQPAPLSPKKVTQMRMARDDVESEDELGAMDTNPTYIKPLSRTPSKPAATRGAQERAKRLAGAGLDLESATRDIDDNNEPTEVDAESLEPSCGILASPARRPTASPAKEGFMGSPARRLDGIVTLDAPTSVANPTVNKVSLLFSPAKRFPVPVKSTGSLEDTSRSPLKTSLLQTPAKRPVSPMKAAFLLKRPDMKPVATSATIAEADETMDMSDDMSGTPAMSEAADVSDSDSDDGVELETDSLTQMLSDMASDAAKMVPDSPTRAKFHARPSPALSRGASAVASPAVMSPAVANAVVEQGDEADNTVTVCEAVLPAEDTMEIDMLVVDVPPVASAKKSPAKPKFVAPVGAFGLRARELDASDLESESEDEQTTRIVHLQQDNTTMATPSLIGKRSSRTPSSRGSRDSYDGRGAVKRLRLSKPGFTPLAEQLSSWKAHSPSEEVSVAPVAPVAENDTENVDVQEAEPEKVAASPALFMEAVHNSTPASPIEQEEEQEQEEEYPDEEQEQEHQVVSTEVLKPIFDKVAITEEDLELAEEANDMSLMEREELRAPNHDDSDDSEEYGDENAIPIDPALMEEEQGASSHSPGVPPVTPQRVMTREFHTVSKVPLKAADDSTPRPVMRRRSLSVSRLSPRRRSSVAGENGTAMSFSPNKKDRRQSRRQSRRDSFSGVEAVDDMVSDEEREIVRSLSNSPAPVTPAKSDGGWSIMGTPARTPRRDIDPALLRGAVVFVDVHTTEGADASSIFVELLTQMGARCVTSWDWDPSSSVDDKEGESSKVGITHVVFKDGGKRTLEKVRESGGVVQCVGVSWVLDCERENEWVDESPYYIDTSMAPRGGARRRKSMDPRALANANGMVSTPVRQTLTTSSVSQRVCFTAPITPSNNRRQSVAWAETPAEGGHGNGIYAEEEEDDENSWMLTAVPKTPAPEAIARYAEEITATSSPMSSVGGDENSEGDDTLMSLGYGGGESSLLMTRTCPPQKKFYELGPEVLSREKDQGVLMRLMSARRKSLQFAPKIGSPLSKAWSSGMN